MNKLTIIEEAIASSEESPDWYLSAEMVWEQFGSFSEFQDQVARMASKEKIDIFAKLFDDQSVIHIKFIPREDYKKISVEKILDSKKEPPSLYQ